RLAENFGDLGIVDGDGDDVVAGRSHMRGDVERGLRRVRLGLDAENRDRFGLAKEGGDSLRVRDQIQVPVSHSFSLVTAMRTCSLANRVLGISGATGGIT